MGKDLYLRCDLPPSVNHYLAIRAFVKNGKPKAMSYKTAEAKGYQDAVRSYVLDEVKRQKWDLIPNKTQHFYIDTVFYFKSIDQDGNNYFKVLLDAITDTQAIWLDDNVTCERIDRIYYDSEHPHVDLHIYPVDYIGIFDNADQLERFKENNCIGCSRYKRNCSLLVKALEGRVQDELTNERCSSCRPSKKGETV